MPESRSVSPIVEAIAFGGLTAGVLDGLDAVIFYRLHSGVTFTRLFQHIASGLIGPAARDGGWPMTVLGIVLHFVVATGAAMFYCTAAARIAFLWRRPFLCGAAFGMGLYLFMQFIVIPMSAIAPRRSGMPALELADQLFSHIVFVGMPIALFARRAFARRVTSPPSAG
jgi:hypothetical protein